MSKYHQTKYHRVWRAKVKKKCKGKCDLTGLTKNLYAHHLNNVLDHWEQRKHVKNGILLTKKLHTVFHCQFMGGFKEKCTKADYEEFKKQILPELHNLNKMSWYKISFKKI